jgi:hypothetical protein
MSNYTKATNFTAKDTLPTGDSNKIVKGTEIDTELTAVASAISSKADINSPTFTGTPSAPTASAGTNTTQIATTAFATAAATAAFPSGGIILWSGSIASIPSGWYLCNGSNGTPDLRDKFIVGAGSSYAVAATGGSKDAIAVAHTHSFSTTTGSAGEHTHTIADVAYFNISLDDRQGGVLPPHWDGIGGSTFSGISTAPDHTHSVSGTTGSTGSSGTNANLPPYYALAYIMKA